MKTIKRLILCTLFALCSLYANAYDFETDGIYYNVVSSTDLTCEVTYSSTSYNTYAGSVTIPETVTNSSDGNTYTVIGIGTSAFRSSASLTDVIIPTTITYIDNVAFWRCSKLTSLTIPNSVTTIGSEAFSYCTTLSSIIIGDGVTTIGEDAFLSCSNLSNVVIGKSVTTIGDSVFASCSNLAEITIPNNVTYVGSYAFTNCTSLKTVILEDGEEPLELYTVVYDENTYTPISFIPFYGCSSFETLYLGREVYIKDSYSSPFNNITTLKNLTIGEKVTYIGTNEFFDCSGLAGELIIPNSVTEIERGAFYNCSSLTSLILGDNLKTIGYSSFGECSGLTGELRIPDSVTEIGERAFYDCSSLIGELRIPDSLTTIDEYAFYGCSGLTSLTIGDSVTTIGEAAFCRCSNLSLVVVGNSVASIANSAFGYCTSLSEITIPKNVTSLGNYAFNECTILETIKIEDEEEALSTGTEPFENCPIKTLYLGRNLSNSPFREKNTLSTLTIGAKVTSVNGFGGCTSLTNVTIKDGEETLSLSITDCPIETLYLGRNLSNSPFRNKTTLSTLTIGEKVTSIGQYEFYGCTNLTGELIIHNGITEIGDYAFYDCSSLTSLTLGDSVTTIGEYAFYDCNSLKGDLVIPNSVTSMGDYVFYNCSGLTSLTIGKSATSIGDYIFYNCSGLTSLTIGESVATIGKYAFYSCSSLIGELRIPNNIIEIGERAFNNCSNIETLVIEDGEETLTMTINSSYSPFDQCSFHTLHVGRDIAYSSNYSPFHSKTSLTSLTIGDKVTSISEFEFYGCTNLTGEVVIPNSVTEIGVYAFYECSSITSLTLGNSVETIGTHACAECSGLKRIYSYNPEPPMCEKYVFTGVDKNTCTLYVPREIISVYSSADTWQDFYKIREILTADELVEEINDTQVILEDTWNTITTDYADVAEKFKDEYDELISDLDDLLARSKDAYNNGTFDYDLADEISDKIEEINDRISQMLKDARQMYELYDELVEEINDTRDAAWNTWFIITTDYADVADNCKEEYESIKSAIDTLRDDLEETYINGTLDDVWAEKIRTQLEEINQEIEDLLAAALEKYLETFIFIDGIYYDVTSDTALTVEAMYGLTSSPYSDIIIIPTTVTYSNVTYRVTSVGGEPFAAGSLRSITIPSSVTSIGQGSFANCSSLTTIICEWDDPSSVSVSESSFEGDYHTATLYVPIGTIAAYQASALWNMFDDIQEYDVLDGTLKYSIKNDGSAELKTEQDTSLSGNVVVAENVVSDGVAYKVKSLAYQAFLSCEEIKSITLPNTVTNISMYAFRYCKGLESVNIPESVTIIDQGVFDQCESLVTFTIHDNITSIGWGAFSGCLALTELVIGSSVTNLHDWAFAHCTSLKSITSLNIDPPTIELERVFDEVDRNSCILYVPEGAVSAYSSADVWKDFYHIVEIGTTHISGVSLDEAEIKGIYNLAGARVNTPTKGEVYIILYTDGTTKKMLIE